MKNNWISPIRIGFCLALMVTAMFFVYSPVNAQVTIRGTVYDLTDSSPLPGAHVSLRNDRNATVTATDGTFSFFQVPQGEYELRVSYVGFTTIHQPLHIQRDTTLLIKLKGSILLGEDVNIVATRAQEKYPTAYSLVGNQEISARNLGKDVPYLIQQIPSAIVSSDAGNGVGYTSINIRGTDLTRINVTVNGIPLNDAESQGVWFVDLPDIASSTGNIQVQRGVGTSTNGAGAFGASINLSTSGMHQDAYGELDISGGSFNTFKSTLRFGTGLLSNQISVDGRLSFIKSDGYIDRASSDLKSYYLSGGFYGKKTTLRLITFSGFERTYQAWQGVPKDSLETNRTYNPSGEYYKNDTILSYYKNQVDNYQQDNYQLIFSQSIYKNWILNTAFHYTHGEGYYENYKQDASFAAYGLNDVTIGSDTITSTNLVNRKMMDNDFYGITFSTTYTIPDRLKMIVGGAWNRYDGEHFGKVTWAEYASNGDNDRNWYYNTGLKKDFNLYLKANYQIVNWLNLFADVQYRHVSYKMAGTLDNLRNVDQDHKFDFFNPKAGLFLTINKANDLYISFGMANREPSRNNYKDADPGQEPTFETLYDYEAGYNLRLPWSTWGVNLYYMNYHNQLVLTGQINNVGEAVMVNVPKSYRLGIELSAMMEFFRKMISWQVNATLSQNRIRDFVQYIDTYDADWNYTGQQSTNLGTTNLSFSPGIVASSTITVKPVKSLAIYLNSKYVGKQYIDNTSNDARSLGGYFVNGSGISYTIQTKLFREIGFSLALNNLFSVKYETNAWVYPYLQNNQYYEANGYFPQALANFLVGISIKL